MLFGCLHFYRAPIYSYIYASCNKVQLLKKISIFAAEKAKP